MNYFEAHQAMTEQDERVRRASWKPESFLMLVPAREIPAEEMREPMVSFLPGQSMIINDHMNLWDGKMLHVGFEPSFVDKSANDWEVIPKAKPQNRSTKRSAQSKEIANAEAA